MRAREARETLLLVGLIALAGWALFESRLWDPRAHLMPRVAAIPLLALLLVQLGLTLRAGVVARGRVEPVLPDVPPAILRRRLASILAWLAGIAALIWSVGFAVGGPAATLAYLRLAAHERWPMSLAITGGTLAFFVLMIGALAIPFPCGELLPGPCDVLVDGIESGRDVVRRALGG